MLRRPSNSGQRRDGSLPRLPRPRRDRPGASVYSATKAALRSFGRTSQRARASQHPGKHCRVPARSRPPVFRKTGLTAEQIRASRITLRAQVALKRIGTSEEVAAAVLFLAADARIRDRRHELVVAVVSTTSDRAEATAARSGCFRLERRVCAKNSHSGAPR